MGRQCACVSELDVRDLRVAMYLQRVNVSEGLQAVRVVTHVLSVHKHFKSLVPAANRHLRERQKDEDATGPQDMGARSKIT